MAGGWQRLAFGLERLVAWSSGAVLAGGAGRRAGGHAGGAARRLLRSSVLRGCAEQQAPRDAASGASSATGSSARSEREQGQERNGCASQFLSAIEASPNGVLILDARPADRLVQQRLGRPLRARPAVRPAPARDQLVRSPAFVASTRRSETFAEPVNFSNPRGDGGCRSCCGLRRRRCKLVLSQDITDRERNEAMRRDFRRQRLARDPHAAHGAGRLHRDAARSAAQRGRARPRAGADDAAGAAHAATPWSRPADAGAAGRQPASAGGSLGGGAPLMRRCPVGCPGAVRRPAPAAFADGAGVRDRRRAERTAQRHPQPGQQRRALHARGGRIRSAGARAPDGGGELERADTGVGIAREHPPADRALLPRRRQPFARHRRHRSGPVDRQACRAAAWRRIEIDSEPGRARASHRCCPAARAPGRQDATERPVSAPAEPGSGAPVDQR